MKNTFMRIFAVLLVIATVASFSGCGIIGYVYNAKKPVNKPSGTVSFANPDYESSETEEFPYIDDFGVLVDYYNLLLYTGCACDFNQSYDTIPYSIVDKETQEMVSFYESVCCNSVEELKAHAEHVFTDAFIRANVDYDMYFDYNGKVYYGMGGRGDGVWLDKEDMTVTSMNNVVYLAMPVYLFDENPVGKSVMTVDISSSYRIDEVSIAYNEGW